METIEIDTGKYKVVRDVIQERIFVTSLQKNYHLNSVELDAIALLRAKKFYVTDAKRISVGKSEVDLLLKIRPSIWHETGIVGFWYARFTSNKLQFIAPTSKKDSAGVWQDLDWPEVN
jgi:hypothetical protein